jgi:hypothetical protein
MLSFVPAMSHARFVFAIHEPHCGTLQLQNTGLPQGIMNFVGHRRKKS